ncbi:iron transporter FeoA [Gammaproteobacteria bacterium SCGC AG-212-F23]|nr:iron transporter FeoA [Gammaproteobacteria bacterium SCGC AG-212-F23]
MQLSQLKPHSKARILAIHPGDAAYRHRLLAMGLVPGTEFELRRKAPLGDPVEIVLRGFSLSLRLKEADILEVEEIL